MASANRIDELDDTLCESISFDELENKLFLDVESSVETSEELQYLCSLKEQQKSFYNPEKLGDAVKDVIWKQFQIQSGIKNGEEFIRDNYNQTLDLRKDAHIQTTDNFENGKIATHNHEINYQERYDNMCSKFQTDENGEIITHKNRMGKDEVTLKKGVRKPFDMGRPTGSKLNHTDMDHTVSAGEIIRDVEANAHLSEQEQIEFANSEHNLHEMDSSLNKSKSDMKMTDWLDNPNARGQKPADIFPISEEEDNKLRKDDIEARGEYRRRKDEGIKKSIETGKRSRRNEAMKMGKTAAKTIVMQLLKDLLQDIISHLVKWLKSAGRTLKNLTEKIKEAIHSFISKLKDRLFSSAQVAATSVATAIFGPIIRTITKIWEVLKQGWSSLKNVINYIKSPQARTKSPAEIMIEIGKIMTAGLSVTGALVLGEVIEKGLMAFPPFAVEIPLIGSLANILGIFLGAVVSGVIGAIVLNLLNKLLEKIQKKDLEIATAQQTNVVIKQQTVETYEKLEKAYNAVGEKTVETCKVAKNCMDEEEDSFHNVENAMDELEAILGIKL